MLGYLKMMKQIVVFFVVYHWIAEGGVLGQCKSPKWSQNEEFPDLFSSNGHKATVEISVSDKKESIYVIENYDRKGGRGQLDILANGIKTKVLYFTEPDELFSVRGYQCESYSLQYLRTNSSVSLPWLPDWMDFTASETFIGPSKMLRLLRREWQNKKNVGLLAGKETVRGFPTNVWAYCLDTNTTVQVYVTDPLTDPAMGLIETPIPVRTVVSKTTGGKTVDQYYEFVGVQKHLANQRDIFQIPIQVGCMRKNKDMKKMPDFANQDLYYEAEVVFSQNLSKDKINIYVSIISVAIHHASQHIAIQMSPWNDKDVKNFGHEESLLKVYDLKNKYVYEVNKNSEECSIKSFREASAALELPDGTKLDFLHPDILISDRPSTGFHYLGEGETRGILASVFEKMLVDDDKIGLTVSTRYYLAENTTINVDFAEKNVPLKLVYLNILSPRENFTNRMDLNYFAFQNQLFQKHQKFDVSLCFPEDTKSKWFQIIFPLNGMSTGDVMTMIPYLEDDFWESLNDNPFRDMLLRFPVVKVDVDYNNIYVTGRLLDRPPLVSTDGKYLGTAGKKLVRGKQQGMLTLENCAKACLEETNCKRFSYCGAMCDIAVYDNTAVESKDGCTLYEDKKLEDTLPTMEKVSSMLAESVHSKRGLILFVQKKPNKPMEFKASKFKYGVGFGLGKLNDELPDVLDERMAVSRYGFKINPSQADESGHGLLEKSLASCQWDCTQSPNCITMSYCKNDQTCFLSTKTPESLKNQIKEDPQCIIYYRPYVKFFEHFPGVVLSKTADRHKNGNLEECALECFKDSRNCRSFDFCPESKDSSCRMHKMHIVSQDEADILQSEVCGHYSRLYLLDFEKKWHEEYVGGVMFGVGNVTAEWCARTCIEKLSCKGFNHCLNFGSRSSTCQLQHASGIKTRESTQCTAFVRN